MNYSILQKIILPLSFPAIFLSFGSQGTNNHALPEISKAPVLTIFDDSIKLVGKLGNFTVDKKIYPVCEGIKLVTFSFSSAVASELQPVSILFSFPSIDINGYWNPNVSFDKVNYYYSGVKSKACGNAPILSFYNNALQNRITIALSDALNPLEITCYLKEEDVAFHAEIKLFHEKIPSTCMYKIELLIDTRALPYYKAVDDVAGWWANKPGYTPMQVPVGAKKPVYSTWYSYHQGISSAEIVAECKMAKSLGCGAIIVDDGWQTSDGSRGYAYTGDWNPDRIPDMKGFVEAVHNEGMQFILWYSLPFMGEKAINYPRFINKYLRYWEGQGAYVLDPRYPEVREYILTIFTDAMLKWQLDGFKLDFMSFFTASKDTKLTLEDGRDYASVNDATDALMTEITKKLTLLKPDILIEFRQPYIGPLMRKYGNMFRGVDAPNNAVANRIEVTNLRIMSQNTAVHSDMFIWRNEEPVECAALQILNILYGVPQLSVKLGKIPDSHLKMIKYWLGYWNTNCDVLLNGEFIPSDPGANYPILTAISGENQIFTVYGDLIVSPAKGIKRLDIINAKASNKIVLSLNLGLGATTIKIFDCTGNIVHAAKTKLLKGIHEFSVPPSGMVSITCNTFRKGQAKQ